MESVDHSSQRSIRDLESMFGAGGAGIWGGLAPPSENILDKPRAPPPRPIPLNFPSHVPKCNPKPLGRRRMAALRKSVLALRRPTDNNEAVLDLMNIHLSVDVPLEELVPKEYLPQRPYAFDPDLEAMLAELKIDNEDAFREVLRQKPKEGRTKPRIAYSRNFYGNLEDISRYMDATDDRYFDATDDEPDADGDAPMSGSDSTSQKKTKPMYQGHRLGNAAQLPPATRIGAARNLLKMVIHKFNCRDHDVAQRERLRIKDINIPTGLVMYNFMIAKSPLDRTLARARNVEGPVMGVSVRNESVFDEDLYKDLSVTREKNEIGECLGSQVDLLRETGSALAIALQRHREGKQKDAEHARITSEWWWAQKPRWGGGETKWGMLANEVFEDEDPSWSPDERKLQYEKRAKAEAEMRRIDEVTKKGSKPGDGLRISDLLAKSEEAASPTSPGGPSPTAGLLAEKTSMRIPMLTPTGNASPSHGGVGATASSNKQAEADEKPPKKKNRLTVPVAGSSSPRQSSPSTSPDTPTSTSSPNSNDPSPTTDQQALLDNKSSIITRDFSLQSPIEPSPTTPSPTMSQSSGNLNDISRLLGRHKALEKSSSNRREEKEKNPEYRDGRKIMYTAPMRRKWFKEWTNVRPNASIWDDKVIWRKIGDPRTAPRWTGKYDFDSEKIRAEEMDFEKYGLDDMPSSPPKKSEEQLAAEAEEWDEVFQLSCVNHHVALCKMRVSASYLRWIETGDPEPEVVDGDSPDGEEKQKQKKSRKHRQVTEADILQMKRSKYYDLFSIEERTEFFTQLWRVMCWLLRDEVPVRYEVERVRAMAKKEM